MIFICLILTKQENKKANYFLAALIFSLAFTLFISLVLDQHWYDQYPALHWLPFSLTYAIGPAFYFYIKFLTNTSLKFERKLLWHFAPILLNYLHSIYHLILGRGIPYPKLHNFTEALEIYAIIPIAIYTWFALKLITKYRREIVQQLSMVDNITLKWIKQIQWVIAISFLPSLVFVIVDYEILIDFSKEFSDGRLFSNDTLLHFASVVSIYWVSIGGFRQAQTYNNKGFVIDISQSIAIQTNPEIHQPIVEKLNKAMAEHQLYLDPTLNLKQLEERLDIDARSISVAINKGLGQNFYAYVNDFRIEEVKQRIVSDQYKHLSILGIALDSGFNSKATFNRIFKEQTGLSPKEFKARASEN